jgi:hypothetical protein
VAGVDHRDRDVGDAVGATLVDPDGVVDSLRRTLRMFKAVLT